MKEKDVKLTGTVLTVLALHIDQLSDESIFERLSKKIEKAPHFFEKSLIIIDLANLALTDLAVDLKKLIKHCCSVGLQPMAFKNVHETVDSSQLSLPILYSKSKSTELDLTEATASAIEPVVATVVTEEKIVSRPSKVITRPIRSGQQIYAEGTDLIILAQVSEGAEVIADGNIHVYGSLRGRALAGVKGDAGARIFCQKMNAELVSIAGNFLLSDDLNTSLQNQAVQISLSGDHLIVDTLK